MKSLLSVFLSFSLLGASQAQESLFQTKSLTPEAALQAAQGALDFCRKQGYQIAVAIVDRGGLVQVLLRDRYAGAHTLRVATDKAWTAASFKNSTLELAKDTQAGKPMSGLRHLPRMMAAGGGLPIEGGGSLLGGIGVSGAPGGDADESCAKAGLKAVAEALEM